MYSVSEYLGMLKLAKRSKWTIKSYGEVLSSYARFLNVPLDDVCNHLLPENLMKYAASRAGMSERGTRNHLSILHRFFEINGVKFDPLETNVLKARRTEDPNDKPLEPATLLRMMDIANVHGKAIISSLVSTGMRAGECSQLLLSDLKGDTIHIRPEIAKGGKGGDVYLSKEAREYLDLWLAERDDWIRSTDLQGVALVKHGGAKPRPDNDQRIFATSYTSMHKMFSRLYAKVDGEKGKYGDRCTLHSCRKYFRTHAVKSMSLDLVEKLMRHSGYLTGEYVRISDEEAREQFHAGEASLYITRADHRIQGGKLDALTRDNKELVERLNRVEVVTAQADREREAITAAGKDFVRADDVERIVREAVKAALKK